MEIEEIKNSASLPAPINILSARAEEDLERTKSFYANSFDELLKLRVTSVQSAEECPRKWFLDNIGKYAVPTTNVHLRIGTICHLLAENYLRRMCFHIDMLTPEETHAVTKELFSITNIKEVQNFLAYTTRLEKFLVNWELLEIEQEYQIPVELSLPVFGQIDCVFRHRTTGAILVLDHKTNRRPETKEVWKAKLQPQAYAFAVMHKYRVNTIIFKIGQVNQPNDIEFEYSSDLIHEVKTRFHKIWDHILAVKDNPDAKRNKYCDYCAHKETCPKYLALKNLQLYFEKQ